MDLSCNRKPILGLKGFPFTSPVQCNLQGNPDPNSKRLSDRKDPKVPKSKNSKGTLAATNVSPSSADGCVVHHLRSALQKHGKRRAVPLFSSIEDRMHPAQNEFLQGRCCGCFRISPPKTPGKQGYRPKSGAHPSGSDKDSPEAVEKVPQKGFRMTFRVPSHLHNK